ncbi:MAG: hypothetical protein DRJ42_06585 [Deltaproteobacteria bacterium]|nr:MAG: hypothetical protein DRJ42_06585 [Deltaproteobacteria bacterium]
MLLSSFGCGDDGMSPTDGGMDMGDTGTGTDASTPVDGSTPDGSVTDAGADASSDGGAPDATVACTPSMPVADGFCEATGTGACYYVDPARGDDANAGTFAAPFRTMANLNRGIYARYRAAGWLELQGGDYVYLRGGTHEAVYHPGGDSGPGDGGNHVIFLDRLATGTPEAPITIKGYPGERAVIDPNYGANGITLLATNHVRISDLTIERAMDRGIRVGGGSGLLIERVVVRDTDGSARGNIAGIGMAGASDVEIRQSVFIDNYDRTIAMAGAQTENSCNIAMFSGAGFTHIHHNAFLQTGTGHFSGCGFKYKHSSHSQTSSFELDHNYFENHSFFAVGVGTNNAHVHHNVVVGAPVAFMSRDFGGITHQVNQLFEYNTVYDARAIMVNPALRWTGERGGPWPAFENVAFRNNVVHDRTGSPDQGRRTVQISTYGDDTIHDVSADNTDFASNCYWADNGVGFGITEDVDPYPAGGLFDLAGWRTTYGWDLDSTIEDPGFSAPLSGDLTPAAGGSCASRGAFADGHAPPTSVDDVLDCL